MSTANDPQATVGGIGLRVHPLWGRSLLRSRVRAENSDVNTATYIRQQLDRPAMMFGFAAQAGLLVARPRQATVLVGINYTRATGRRDVAYDMGIGTHDLQLHPIYESLSLVIDATIVERLVGFELSLGGGTLRGGATGDFDTIDVNRRSGYLLGLGIRGRVPVSPWFAVSAGAHYEILGFFPRLWSDWYNGDLLSLRIGAELDWWMPGGAQ